MKLKNAKPNSLVRRLNSYGLSDYVVLIDGNDTARYCEEHRQGDNIVYVSTHVRRVGKDSPIWAHTDFVYVDEFGNKIKENEMRTDVNYIGGEYKIVVVDYDLAGPMINTYNFKCDVDMEVSVDSLVVVESTKGVGIAKVLKVLENNVDNADAVAKATAWVVDVIDTTMQEKRKEATSQRKYILQQLDEKQAQLEAVSVYEMLAKVDPDAKKLLDQLKELGK